MAESSSQLDPWPLCYEGASAFGERVVPLMHEEPKWQRMLCFTGKDNSYF